MQLILEQIVVFRFAERLALSTIILIIAAIVMVAFWKSVQKIDFQISREKIGIGGSVMLSTPLFVLLALIGYGFVSLSNPVIMETSEGNTKRSFLAASPFESPDDGDVLDDKGITQLRAKERIMSLNCIAQKAGEVSARIVDDVAEIKVQLMKPVWSKEWGDFNTFQEWARGRSQEAPNEEALTFYEGKHFPC